MYVNEDGTATVVEGNPDIGGSRASMAKMAAEVLGIPYEHVRPVVLAMSERPREWVDFMMRFELGLEKPDPKRARNSAVVIALSYLVGGLIPLGPYMLMHVAQEALLVSVVVTLIALAVFGYVKGRYTGAGPWKSALQTTIVGSLAAAAAFLIAKAIT